MVEERDDCADGDGGARGECDLAIDECELGRDGAPLKLGAFATDGCGLIATGGALRAVGAK